MIGISKTEAKFIQTCFNKKRYFLTNESFRQYFPELSEKAIYQMIYRLKKKKLIYAIMNGQYLIRPIDEWLGNKLTEKSFTVGVLSYLSSIGAILSGSSAFYFIKNKCLPNGSWEVTTLEPVTRSKTLKAENHKQKLKFHYSKKISSEFNLYKIDDLIENRIEKPKKPKDFKIPLGYFGVEPMEAFL